MVHFMSSQNMNNNVWQTQEPEPDYLVGDGNPMFVDESGDDEPLRKRWKSLSGSSQTSQTTATQQLIINNNELPVPQYHYNPLNEPSPLGLRLRKSPSLLELAQKRLNQSNVEKGDLSVENVEARTKSKARTRARASSSNDKLKASHFPAVVLRIGQWEYVSKHEGDLVAKCYFSKHKIVWEVLDGGLKKKFEINWADIMALKANFVPDGPGSLTIVLDKQPLYFKEINPQPRKHTQWRATSDFTDGEASTHRQHFLQCAPGVLDKHYEKLIQCDTRLNFLSQQHDYVLNFPYFPPKAIKDQDIPGGFNLPEMYIANMPSPSIFHTSSPNIVESSSVGLMHQEMSKEAYSSSSGISMDIDGQKDSEQTMSVSNLINYMGNSLSEQHISGNVPYSNKPPGHNNPKDMLENISEILLSDSQLTSTSDERTLMSRVNSLCCLIGQQDGNVRLTPQVRNDSFTPESFLIPKSTQKDGNDSSTPGSSQLPQQENSNNSNPENETQHDGEESGIPRNDSFADLVHQLPRIESLPRFLFDISENGEILK